MAVNDFQREVLTSLSDIRERVARMEAAQEIWLEARDREIKEIKAMAADHEDRIRPLESEASEIKKIRCCVNDHENRIRPLESQHSKMLGISAVSGVAAAIVIALVKWAWSLVRS